MTLAGKRVKRGTAAGTADALAAAHADVFVSAGRERATAEKAREVAKLGLIDWLAGEPSKTLPDGRTVALASVLVPAELEPRRELMRKTLTVSPAPPA